MTDDNVSKFIEWRTKHKEQIRSFIMVITVLLLMHQFFFALKPAVEEINADYNKEKSIKLEQLRTDLDLPVLDYNNNYGNLTIDIPKYNEQELIVFEHAPEVQAIWAILNIIICFFIISLLWN